MQLVSLAGGVTTTVLRDEIHIAPIFVFDSLIFAKKFVQWLDSNFQRIKEKAEATTRYGKLVRLEPNIIDRNVIVKFCYTTGDAMGLNIITVATDAACKFITATVKPRKFYLQANFSAVKKVSAHNMVAGYGKTVIAEAIIPNRLLRLTFGIDSKKMVDYFEHNILATTHAGMIGSNGHTANALTALFIACGQDAASVVESHVCITNYEVTEGGELYISTKFPNLVLGTVGGGTGLGTQMECLELIGCKGAGKAKKFAEIAAAAALSGEVAICGANASGSFVEGLKKFRKRIN
jgi:hydroxymethylglutaryl-CoA reductase (NADPH)